MILLDTCVLLKLTTGSSLPSGLKEALSKSAGSVSCLSAWEIGIKAQSGKLPLRAPLPQWWRETIELCRLKTEMFTSEQAVIAATLPLIHTDPFDRAIIATALTLKIPLATVDPVFDLYAEACGLVLAGR